MLWIPMASYELALLEAFLLVHEEMSLNALALLYQESGVKWPPSRQARFWKTLDSRGTVRGIIAFRNQSTLIPVLPGPGPWPDFSLPVPKGRHFSLLGPLDWITPLAVKIPLVPYKYLEYELMSGPEIPGIPGELPPDWELHTAGAPDRDLLFPLQAAYEKEEVVFSPEEFEPWACYHNLKILLEKEKVWYVQDGTYRPRAKGGTNAKGKYWSQLGGIFTDPGYRNQGVAKVLVQVMVNELLQGGYRSSLFVKKQNIPALALYRSLGFRTRSDFIISYYNPGPG